jgi:IMP and pyridine-specific 5'-nucleotidase
MSRDTKIGIVTAAGYTEAERYYERLHGLLKAIKESNSLTPSQKQNLIVMGNPTFHLAALEFLFYVNSISYLIQSHRWRVELSIHILPFISLSPLSPHPTQLDLAQHVNMDPAYHH